jgi:hypothetical protein
MLTLDSEIFNDFPFSNLNLNRGIKDRKKKFPFPERKTRFRGCDAVARGPLHSLRRNFLGRRHNPKKKGTML